MKMRVVILWVGLLLAALTGLLAQEVTAGLSSPSTSVGQPVELVVTVRDSRNAEVPQTVDVAGLRIELFGRATRFEMNNFKVTSSLTYTYSVVPLNAGEFTIPPIEVKVDKKTLKTAPARLSVMAGAPPALPAPQPLPNAPSTRSDVQPPAGQVTPYFGDLLLSKKKAYVGEVVPAELRYYFNSRISGEVGDRPNFGGEGFTAQKLSHVPKREQIVNGENYIVFGFQTGITPVKSGALEIPTSSLEARLQVPGSPPPGFADIFQQFGGALPPGMFTSSRDVSIDTKPVTMEVVPLPKEGKPENFSGAIGKFKMEASANPKKAAPGDPITIKVLVTGQGNFDAMGAPELTDDEGWRSYPPTDKFEPADAIHFTGTKTFEFVLIAKQDRIQTPGLKFTYFDPATGTYETLTQAPFDVEAKAGEAKPEASPVGNVTSSPTPKASLTSSKSVVHVGGDSSWTPLFKQPFFLLLNLAVATVWGLALVYVLVKKLLRSAFMRRRSNASRLKRLIADLEACEDRRFYDQAAGCLASLGGADPENLDAGLTTEDSQVLRFLIERIAESKYSPNALAKPTADERGRVMQVLTRLVSQYAK
jgi:hypothetical protein